MFLYLLGVVMTTKKNERNGDKYIIMKRILDTNHYVNKCVDAHRNKYSPKIIDKLFVDNDNYDDFNIFMHIVRKYNKKFASNLKLKIPKKYEKDNFKYENIDMQINFTQMCKKFVECVICKNDCVIKMCNVKNL